MFQPLAEQSVPVTLYTDAYVVRGQVRTRQRRLSDMFNQGDRTFLVVEQASYEEFGTGSLAHRCDYAQVNLGTVLFAVADVAIAPMPELRTPKVAERAFISVPPFKVIGHIHLLPERDLRDALDELVGQFIPVTDAIFWGESVGEARQNAPMVAVNHARAQILAPFVEVDPWEGLDRGGAETPPAS